MENQELIGAMKDLTAALLVNSIFQATQLKDVLMDKPEENLETVRMVCQMWEKMKMRLD
jgi:hypothetical protein